MTGTGPQHRGRLRFQPGEPVVGAGETGLFAVPTPESGPPAMAYVPDLVTSEPLRLVVYLHGAGGTAKRAVQALRPFADDQRLLLLAPKATAATWDVIAGGYGPDVANLDALLEAMSSAYPVRGYTLAGFSDGASYALSLGLTNGDVFDSIIAFSPGFGAAVERAGTPRLFVSHGTQDSVLPIDQCSRRLVPILEGEGYDVRYDEFAGGHEVPQSIKQEAVNWLGAP